MIALMLTCPAEAATFSSDQCKLMRMMRVDMKDICPRHAKYTVSVKSQRAVEASYNPTINGVGPSGGINAGPARGGAGYAGGGPAGNNDAGGGVGEGDSGSTPDGGRPGFGGGERGDYGGDNRPVGKPPAFVPKFERNPAFKPPDLTKEQRRRLVSKIRKEREEGDWNPGNIGKPGRPGKAHEGRNSR